MLGVEYVVSSNQDINLEVLSYVSATLLPRLHVNKYPLFLYFPCKNLKLTTLQLVMKNRQTSHIFNDIIGIQ